MSEPQNQDDGIPLKSTTQETSPPKIEITPATAGRISLPRSSVLNLDPTPTTEEQDTTPQASSALPGTESAEENTADATTSSVPGESSTSDKPSTDPAMKSMVNSTTQPTNAKPTDGTVPTTVDPNTGVAKVSEARTLLILAS